MPKSTLVLVMTVITAVICSTEASAKMREDVEVELKGPRGGGVSVTTAKKNAEYMANAVDFARIVESGKDVLNMTYNPDGTINSVTYSSSMHAYYSYSYNTEGNIEKCSITTEKSVLNFSPNKNGTIKMASVRSADEPENENEILVLFDSSDMTPTMSDLSHRPIPFGLISGINKALDDLAKAKSSALEDYKLSSAEYYSKVETALYRDSKTLKSKGIDVDILLKDAKKDGVPEEARRRAIDEAVGYIRAAAARDRTGRTAREFIDFEQRSRDMILVSALKTYNDKIKEAVEYINKIIESLMKSKLAVFMSADKDKIDAIINLPEIKKATAENPGSRQK